MRCCPSRWQKVQKFPDDLSNLHVFERNIPLSTASPRHPGNANMAATKTKLPSSKRPPKSKTQQKPAGITKKKTSKTAPKPVQQKTKSSTPATKKKRIYTEKELGIPQLNGIRPTGVQKPPNAKKGKNFVDDREGMAAILAISIAQREGNIESKMMRARQLEEIREARRLETEQRAEGKKRGLEERKQDIKDSKKRRRRTQGDTSMADDEATQKPVTKKSSKRVSFG